MTRISAVPRDEGRNGRGSLAKKTKDDDDMSTSRTASGLCLNCRHAPTCTFARESSRPVLHCNEYECFTPQRAPAKHKKQTPPVAAQGAQKAIDKDLNNYAGLCVNCENRETCALRKPEGGVWHCNEYQ